MNICSVVLQEVFPGQLFTDALVPVPLFFASFGFSPTMSEQKTH